MLFKEASISASVGASPAVASSDSDTCPATSSPAKLKRKRSITAACSEDKDGRGSEEHEEPTLDMASIERSSPSCARRRMRLRIDIPNSPVDSPNLGPEDDTEYDGLFTPSSSGSAKSQTIPDHPDSSTDPLTHPRATRAPPPIPGLYLFTPPHACKGEDDALASSEKARPWPMTQSFEESLLQTLTTSYFRSGQDQVMLFGTSSEGVPPALGELLRVVRLILETCDSHTPSSKGPPECRSFESPSPEETRSEILDLIFPTHEHLKRQAIINFYLPGEGITPHVDLLGRYADGIVGVSLGSGCVMTFTEVVAASSAPGALGESQLQASEETPPRRYDVYLPRRSVIVLSGPARYEWAHGIEERVEDWVDGEVLARRERLSVTFRWMLEGADVVGGEM